MKLNPKEFTSYAQFGKAAVKFSEHAKKELGKQLYTTLVAADLAGRKDFAETGKLQFKESHFDEAIKEFLGKLPVSAKVLAELEAKYRRFVFGTRTLIGLDEALQGVILERMRDLIVEAIRGELLFAQFVEKMNEIIILPEARLNLIFQQNLMQAYSAGAWEQIYEMVEDVDLIFETARDERVESICASCDSFVAPKSDPIWSEIWPPVHFLCRCIVRLADEDDLRTAKRSVDTSEIPREFKNWPGDGFAIIVPTIEGLTSLKNQLEDL